MIELKKEIFDCCYSCIFFDVWQILKGDGVFCKDYPLPLNDDFVSVYRCEKYKQIIIEVIKEVKKENGKSK